MSFQPQTPVRPVPGTFFQTPGPALANGPLFRTKPSSSTSAPAEASVAQAIGAKAALSSTKAKSEKISPRERGALTVDEALTQDSRYLDLDLYLSQGFSSEYDIPTSSSWAPFQKVKMYNIPDQIFEQYNRAQVSTSMGLFAELNHAWVTIDNALYLWNYTHPNPQLIGFEEQPNSINAVKLARPRKGVFLPSITHVLIITTTAEIILLGLGCEMDGTSKSVALYSTGMSTSIRGLDINVIASSDASGRIFFAGSTDDDVYELKYQQEERWFQGRCSKVNHTTKSFAAFAPQLTLANKPQVFVEQMVVDDSRNLLYTLSSNSCIRVFHLKQDGTISLSITKQAAAIYSNIAHTIGTNETLNARVKIVSISPISAQEAQRYHLMATTATGYRIYLSATSSYSWSLPSPNTAPTSMQVNHVITPPPDSPAPQAAQTSSAIGSQPYQPASRLPIQSLNPTRSAQRFPPGHFFCFAAKDPLNRTDTLFISTPDSGRIPRPEMTVSKPGEIGHWLALGSRAEDIGLCLPGLGPEGIPGFRNELAIQFDQPAAEVAILTNTGVHILRRRRLVDIFASLIRSSNGEEGLESQVKTLLKLYGRSEVLATALAVACGQGVEVSQDSRLSSINDPDVLEFARKVFIEFGGKPSFDENIVTDGATLAIDAVTPSPRHAGIAIYSARLLRSIWKTVIVKQERTPAGGVSYVPAVSTAKLHSIQKDLSALQDFFRANKTFIEGLSGPDALSRAATKQEEVSLQAEHRALHSLVQLVSHTIEGISFVLVLFDERVQDTVSLLPEGPRSRFLSLTFEQLFSSPQGHDVAKELVKAIVNSSIAKGSNVETIAEALRRRCGSFCSAEDVLIFKGQEQLKRATEAGVNSEFGRNLLNESLGLFMQVSETLPMDYLKSAVEQYAQSQFYAGAIQLCLTVAADSDKGNRALAWLMGGRPVDDARQENYETRKQCYNLIYDIIQAVDQLASKELEADGQYTLITKRKNEAYSVITNSQDEVFLTSLYDWYLERGWSDRLLQTQSPFVVTYLTRKSTEDVFHADLLWKYYGQSSRFYDAAAVQLQLAHSPFPLSLDQRINYLGQANSNASTFTHDVSRAARQRLQLEISNLLDVANVQDDILQRLKDDTRISAERREEVLREVGGEIMELSTLFNVFADPGGYHDICLQIMYLANHRNTSDIKASWESLIKDVHDEASEKGTPLPYEAVIEKVRSLAHRLRMSEIAFPVPILLPMLERYVLEHQAGVGPQTWVIDLFLDLQVAHETLYTILESMFYNDEVPFQGRNRGLIATDLVYLISRWYQETVRIGGGVFGSDVLASRVSELLLLIQQSGVEPEIMEVSRDLRASIQHSLR